MIDLTKREQVARLIQDTVNAANGIVAAQARLRDFMETTDVNQVHDALTAAGATFPAEFSLTPALIEDARFAIATLRDLIQNSFNAGTLTALDRVRLNYGVLAGTG